MSIVLAILMSGLILGYVLYPLFMKNKLSIPIPLGNGDSSLRYLMEAKTEALRAIKEIDFEYQLGKISREDYEELKGEYQRKAVEVLKQLDALQNSENEDDPLEKEIKNYRQKLVKSGSQLGKMYCPHCGKEVKSSYHYCVHCGKQLHQN
ncbi:MAG: zinc-ribbon domain-containing protein [Calditrichaeota bacterium]|nr:MAG: zinc-ribbon domain-containing protein [Calditrichota bacterium]